MIDLLIGVVIVAGIAYFIYTKKFKKADVPIPSKPFTAAGYSDPTPAPAILKPRPDASYALPTQDNITDRLFRPSAENGAAMDARIGDGSAQFGPTPVESVPMQWENRRFLVYLSAGAVYSIRAPVGRGFMVAGGEGGADSLFNGSVGATTIKADASGIVTLVSSKSCQAWLDPL